MKSIVILISGRGSNMVALIDAAASGGYQLQTSAGGFNAALTAYGLGRAPGAEGAAEERERAEAEAAAREAAQTQAQAQAQYSKRIILSRMGTVQQGELVSGSCNAS